MARRTLRTAGLRQVAAAVALTVLALVMVAALATGAGAAVDTGGTSHADTVVVVTGDVRVPATRHVDDVILVNGDLSVAGVVDGDVFVVNGNVVVTGRVKGDVTSLNGRVSLGADAFVGGDVVSKDPARIADGAHVGGSVDRARDRFALGRLGTIGRVVLWVAATVSSLLLGVLILLVAPHGAAAVVTAGRRAVGASIGLGFAVVFGVPFLGVIFTVTILGLPFGLALLFALALLYGTGYALGALLLGRVMVRPPRSQWLAFFAGWGVLRVLAIVPVLGALVLFATVVYGLGAATVAIHRSQRRVPVDAPAAPAEPAATPTSPSPTGPTAVPPPSEG